MQDALSTYLADVDPKTFLGRLAWFTVCESNTPHAQLAAEMKAAGLDDFIPRPIRDDDVFRRVFHNGQRRKLAKSGDELFENLLVRELVRGEGKIIKRVVVEEVDQKGKRLGYSEALEITFDAADPSNVKVKVLDVMHPDALAMVRDLAAEYRNTRGTVDARGVRGVVRRVLETAMATAVRPGGGVYFVMEDKAEHVVSLERLAQAIPGCDVHSLPLVDDGKQRDMLKKAFEDESVGEIDRSITEIIELVKAGEPITPAKFAALTERRAALVAKTKEYAGLLEDSLSGTEFRLKMFEKEMSQLFGLVSSEARRRTA